MYKFYQACSCTKMSPDNCKKCDFGCIGFTQDGLSTPMLDTWFHEIIRGERYELVEKKDWKINDLKLRLEVAKANFRKNGEEITRLQYLENDYAKAILDLENELKELES